jgi:hypothetical protein
MQEAFIQIRGEAMEELERAIKAIEALGGRVMHSYPPQSLIALVPPEKINELRGQEAIASVDTGQITDDRAATTGDTSSLAIAAWNEHVNKQGAGAAATDPTEGLSWDDSSRLPPDPPQKIREMLRRRELDLESDEEP